MATPFVMEVLVYDLSRGERIASWEAFSGARNSIAYTRDREQASRGTSLVNKEFIVS